MTKYEVAPGAQGLQIKLLEVGSNKDQLLESFGACATGDCACSTDEYEKVESMDIVEGDGSITINVKSKIGETIDPSCVTDCLTEITGTTKESCC